MYCKRFNDASSPFIDAAANNKRLLDIDKAVRTILSDLQVRLASAMWASSRVALILSQMTSLNRASLDFRPFGKLLCSLSMLIKGHVE